MVMVGGGTTPTAALAVPDGPIMITAVPNRRSSPAVTVAAASYWCRNGCSLGVSASTAISSTAGPMVRGTNAQPLAPTSHQPQTRVRRNSTR